MQRVLATLLIFLFLFNLGFCRRAGGRGGSRRGKSKGGAVGNMQMNWLANYRSAGAEQYYESSHGAKIVKASHFDQSYVLGHKVMFVCEAKGIPRPHITWIKDGAEIMYHEFMQVHERYYGKDRVKSKLEIDPATQMDAGVYECQADNLYAIDKKLFKTDFVVASD
ncbi:immunoglobulin domain-containing protein oig-4-like [Artemia franciscana]|uniref:Ig-like domain-containing protein n=2 Tax=Artemia franciscana TaxID=6661 RepID=A0AA88KRZ0_ARTSF|nr:hypothetical protein QYM36_017800 [Artemia franciscana]